MMRARLLTAAGFSLLFAAIAVAPAYGPLLPPALAQDGMSMVAATPTPGQIMDGSSVAFLLRFDRPIDHAKSKFVLATPAGDRSIPARLDAEPNSLVARAGRLPPGRYEVRWRAKAIDGRMLSGSIPFEGRGA
jgi:methionine-rich copper-binding protein CopC